MAPLTSALLLSLLASTALAGPQRSRHHHTTGTGGNKKPCSTAGPYAFGNGTEMAGATGTGTGFVPIVLSTATVVPLPASTPEDSASAAPMPASSTAAAGGACPSGTVTTTYTPTIIVTASSANAAGAASSGFLSDIPTLKVSAPFGNGTTTEFDGPTGTAGPTAVPMTTENPESTFGTAAPLPRTTTKKHGHKHQSLHSIKPNKWTSVMVNSPAESSSTAAAVVELSTTTTTTTEPTTMATFTSPARSSTTATAVNTPPAESSAAAPAANSPPAYTPPSAVSSAAAPVNQRVSIHTPPAYAPPAYTPPAASPSTPPTSTSGSSSGSGSSPLNAGSKRGLVYNTASLTSPFAKSTNIPWAYNWDSQPAGLSSAYNFVPMLWGLDSDHTRGFNDHVHACKTNGSTHLLAFNEPDRPHIWGGSELTPAVAAQGFKDWIKPFQGQLKLGTPGVSNGNSSADPPMGMPWLKQWVAACGGMAGCPVDFIVVHWYGDARKSGTDQAADLKWYIDQVRKDMNAIWGRELPIWLTEFAASPPESQSVNEEFLKIALPYLDGEGAVERYSYFMVTEGRLVSQGALTATGKVYAGSK